MSQLAGKYRDAAGQDDIDRGADIPLANETGRLWKIAPCTCGRKLTERCGQMAETAGSGHGGFSRFLPRLYAVWFPWQGFMREKQLVATKTESGALFGAVGIEALAHPFEPVALRAAADQDQGEKRGEAKHEYGGMQEQPGFEIVEQVQHRITSTQFPPIYSKNGEEAIAARLISALPNLAASTGRRAFPSGCARRRRSVPAPGRLP